MDTDKLTRTLLGACSKVLRPLIKIMLRHGVGFNAFSDMTKRLFIEVARTEYALPGKKQTASRLSTMTGLSRKEVRRVSQLPDFEAALDAAQINRAARVISGWARDKQYQDEHGEPLDLAFDDDGPSFTSLVKQYSGDITARTIADELMRVGAISVQASGKIRLQQRAYVPRAGQIQQLNLLGIDVADLIETFNHNMLEPARPFVQRKVCYEKIAPECCEHLRGRLAEQAQSCLESMQNTIVSEAQTAHGKLSKRIGVGIYYFESQQEAGL